MGYNEKLFNKEIFKMIFRKVGWVGALFQIMLLGVVAFPLFLQAVECKNDPEFWLFHESLFAVATEMQFMILVFVPLILGMFMYNFLMNKKASIFTHSLPISRKSIYLHHTISGIVMIVAPIIITAIISWIINETSTIPAEVKDLYIYLDWVLIACSVSFVMFSASTLIAMVTGNFIIQGALTFGMLFLPIISYRGLVSIITRLFPSSDFQLTFGVPRLHEAVYQYTLVAIVVSAVILLLSYIIYLRRDIENSSSPIVFKGIRPIFKYVVTLVGLFLASLFIYNFATSTAMYFITLVIGAFIGYFVAVMVVKKSKLLFREFIGFFIFIGLFTFVFIGMVRYAPTYESYVPDIEEISSITIQDDNPQSDYDEELTQEFVDLATFTDEESFKIITEMHQDFIDALPEEYDPATRYKQITFTYNLDNGKEISRSYNIYGNRDEIAQTLINIPEFIENYCEYLDDTVRNNAEVLNISCEGHSGTILKEDEAAFNGFLDALISDVAAVGLAGSMYTDYEGIRFDASYVNVIGITSSTLKEITITDEYVNTIKWLEDNVYDSLTESIESSNN